MMVQNARALLRTHLLAGDEEHPDRTELAFADIKRVLIECDITAPEDVKPFLVKINISSANRTCAPPVAQNLNLSRFYGLISDFKINWSILSPKNLPFFACWFRDLSTRPGRP